jgi:Protein of unknown function (DUF2752)
MSSVSEPVRPSPTTRHVVLGLVAVAVLAASFCLQVLPDGERVSIRSASDATLPPVCISRTYLGIKCPGCGLTRSFVHLAHGDPLASFHSHRLGWLLFALTLAQIPYRLHLLFRPGKSQALLLFARWAGRVLIVLLLANWLGEQLFG